MAPRVKHLVVDTNAFINAAPIREIGEKVYTIQEVIDEITCKRQLRHLSVLSYDLIIKDVFVENIKFVTEFSKKSGDYPSLSAVDIKVVALAYQLEKEIVGDSHLTTAPKIRKDVSAYNSKPNESKHAMGFFMPVEKKSATVTENTTTAETEGESKSENDKEEDLGVEETESVDLECESIQSKLASLQMTEEDESENILVPISNNEDDYDEEDDEIDEDVSSDEDEDDGDDWITIDNLEQMKKKMDNGLYIEDVSTVACMTADFAMQNVLKQIGLNVSAYDGRLIRMVRTFILRCITCFKTTSVMTKTFCPNCGHASLKKVSVSLDENGKQQIFINTRRPLTSRGKRFSLPAPRGGPHAQNPILNADQAFPRCKPTKLARTKNNPLNTDYIAGYSPFVMRDVNSKSAVLGIRNNNEIKNWMRKNPNEVRRRRK